MEEFGRLIYRDTFFSLTVFISCLLVKIVFTHQDPSSVKYFPVPKGLSAPVCCFSYATLPYNSLLLLCPLLNRSSWKSVALSLTRTWSNAGMFCSWKHSLSVCKTTKYIYWLKWRWVNFSLLVHDSCTVATFMTASSKAWSYCLGSYSSVQ